MKRVIRRVSASSDARFTRSLYFTPNEVVELLTQIKELKDCRIAHTESRDGSVEFIIGNSAYYITKSDEEGFSV